ncbi:MAG: DUF1501 domain-containing protein, partial [Saprospiraceae bacterium]|nr:DUF1501 domain-containing protein [Saprospiraceae bacterium]
QSIVDASNAVPNQKTYPDTPLAAKLKVISRLIAGGLKTRLYMVSIGGFDTHDQQVDPHNHSLGIHANLLRELGDAIKSFTDDLAFLGTADRVVGMTFSEFGRRITSNYSMGTDHGEAAPLFLFGKPVAGGVTGANPAIPPNPSVLDNLNMEFDFRSVYASVLRDWFCVPQEDVGDILLHDFPFLNLFQAGVPCLSTAVHDAHQAAGRSLLRLWPNPVRGQVTFEYDTAGGMTQLQVLDQNGRIVATPVSSWQPKGQYQESWDASGLASGTYYCRLVNERQMQSKMLVKVE